MLAGKNEACLVTIRHGTVQWAHFSQWIVHPFTEPAPNHVGLYSSGRCGGAITGADIPVVDGEDELHFEYFHIDHSEPKDDPCILWGESEGAAKRPRLM